MANRLQKKKMIEKLASFFKKEEKYLSLNQYTLHRNQPERLRDIKKILGGYQTAVVAVQKAYPKLLEKQEPAVVAKPKVKATQKVKEKTDPLEALRASKVEK